MSPVTTHVLDTSVGRPGIGVPVTLEHRDEAGGWREIARKVTNADGRVADLLSADEFKRGVYRLRFDTGAYFAARGAQSFYPAVEVTFDVQDETQHYHVPLLVSPFGYSTYRGS